MSIGHRIRELRLGSQMTQRELAAASGLAVAYLSRIENSKVTPGITTLNKIARALSIPMPTDSAAAARRIAESQQAPAVTPTQNDADTQTRVIASR